MSDRWDETWQRLREWTSGQGPSERLAAQLLRREGFESVDPAHPLGGPDGGSDGQASRNGHAWRYAVYFPRGEKPFGEIETKFAADLNGAVRLGCVGFVFVTNQELRLAERKKLEALAGPLPVELFHLERVTSILDDPSMSQVRTQFLSIAESDDVVQASRGADRRTLASIQELFPSDSAVIVFLKDYDLAGMFKWETLDPLREFVHNRAGAEHAFLDAETEVERLELLELGRDFLTQLAYSSGREHGAWSAIVPARDRDDFRLTNAGDYVRIVAEINERATRVYQQHQKLIEVARRRLGA